MLLAFTGTRNAPPVFKNLFTGQEFSFVYVKFIHIAACELGQPIVAAAEEHSRRCHIFQHHVARLIVMYLSPLLYDILFGIGFKVEADGEVIVRIFQFNSCYCPSSLSRF